MGAIASPVPRRGSSRANLPALLLILAGISLVLVSCVAVWLNWVVGHPSAAPLPQELAGLSLTSSITGRQAVADIHQMHGKDFPLTSGAIGYYGDNQATIWVSGVLLPPLAQRVLNSMRDRIAEGRSPFKALGEERTRGRTVYLLEGMGQQHYYFRSSNLVIWLAVDPHLAGSILTETLAFYP